jgi:hypothetical protein
MFIKHIWQLHGLSKSRQWINEPGIDFHIRIERIARQADMALDVEAIHMRLNPQWKNALAIRHINPTLRPGELLALLCDGSFVFDDPNHPHVNMTGAQGQPYVPPRHECLSMSSKCIFALEDHSPRIAAIGNSPIDWSKYPHCVKPSRRPVIHEEFRGDIRIVVGLRELLKKAERFEKCQGVGVPDCWSKDGKRKDWYYDARGLGYEHALEVVNAGGQHEMKWVNMRRARKPVFHGDVAVEDGGDKDGVEDGTLTNEDIRQGCDWS